MTKLREGESVITAWCEGAAGPGWANSPVWYIVRDGDGRLRQECLQPSEQTRGLWLLYPIAASAHSRVVREVESVVARKKGFV